MTVKLQFVNPKDRPNKLPIRIYEYEGWSLNNTGHTINICCKSNEELIYLVSETEISEVEIYGIHFILLNKANSSKWLDITIDIFKGYYDVDCDYIRSQYILDINTRKWNANKATQFIGVYNKNILKESKSIIGIHYKGEDRSIESWWWKLTNSKKSIINNYALFSNWEEE